MDEPIKIPLHHFLTAQELVHLGSTPDLRLIKEPEDWFVPQGSLLRNPYPDEEMTLARRSRKVISASYGHLRDANGNPFQINGTPGFTLEELVGKGTNRDPRIVEFEEKDSEITRITERADLTEAVVRYFEGHGIDLHRRPTQEIGEGQNPGGERNG